MRRMCVSVVVLLAILLAGCGKPATPAPTPTLTPSPLPPTATVAPAASPAPSVGNATGQGGIEVALGLAVIPKQDNVAVVGGDAISTTAYQQELTRALYMVTSQYGVDWSDPKNQALLPSFQEQVLDQMIERVVIRQLANKESVSVAPEDIATEVTALQDNVQQSGQFADWATFLKGNGLTEESVRAMLADNLLYTALSKLHVGPTSVEQVHAQHILVATQETGQEVLDKLAKGEAFADLAAQYSTDTGSKDKGGDLGWFPRGVMVPEFEQAAFSLKPGETSGLVQTQYGYHIIKVLEKEVREIDPAILEQVQQQQFQTWLTEQKAGMSIERLYKFQTP